jgi:hypothetical protein
MPVEKLTSNSGAIVQYESDSDVKILSDDQAYEQVNFFFSHYSLFKSGVAKGRWVELSSTYLL